MEDGLFRRLKPLQYDHAEQNLLIMLVGFAVSVIATRSFLELAGYPQIASGDFHIAHVLWGGLLLYVSALLLLIWRGRRIQWLSSLLTGVGFGLFIDEIGKFITRDNDYFYPLAAPLIYAFFLLSVLIYLWIRKRRSSGAPMETYRVLDLLERGLDPVLTAQEQVRIQEHLRQIAARSVHQQIQRLAESAVGILENEPGNKQFKDPNFMDRWLERFRAIEAQWIGQTRFKAGLALGFLFLALRGLLVAVFILVIFAEVLSSASWQQIVATPWGDGNPIGAPRLILFAAILFFEAVIGILLLIATGLLIAGKMRRGMALGYWVLLFSLMALHLPVFYFEQFEGIATTILQFGLLLGIIRYRAYFPDSKSSK